MTSQAGPPGQGSAACQAAAAGPGQPRRQGQGRLGEPALQHPQAQDRLRPRGLEQVRVTVRALAHVAAAGESRTDPRSTLRRRRAAGGLVNYLLS